MKYLLMRMECGIFINVQIFMHLALSLEREVDTELNMSDCQKEETPTRMTTQKPV